ncbi:MAG TPA: glucose/sorbosone dehydrogenase [Candidatus Angelobacter sp.]|nr:glucose/sorbosone dehydrogenase [Candidatus Angelobacter sp.]
MKRTCFALIFTLALASGFEAQSGRAPVSRPESPDHLKLVPHIIHLADGKTFSLNLPEGLDISIAAQGLKRVRFMAKSPDGRIFVTDMYNRTDNSRGTIYILDGFDAQSGKFARVIPYLQHLRNPNSVAFYTDPSGQAWLYVPLTDKLERFRFRLGEESPTAQPEVLTTYPDYGLNYKYGGWHLTRTVAFGEKENQGNLYISVGSSCNACEEKEEVRASLAVMSPEGKNARFLARGLRNAVGLRMVGGTLYATNMGADHLGDDAPDDTLFTFNSTAPSGNNAANYGWPYCYFKDGKVFPDPTLSSAPKAVDCSKTPQPFATFAAHSSPLGLEYFDSTAREAALRNYFLVALHGSSKRRLKRGYRVVRLTAHSRPQDFITGFLQNGVLYGRPCDILRVAPDSFLLTDDYSGVIYYVRPKISEPGRER